MLIGFFEALRAERVPVGLREWLDLIAALDADFAFADPVAFFHLGRTVLVKDERHYDRYERAFAAYFSGVARIDAAQLLQIPDEWLRESFKRLLSAEELAKLTALGGLDKLLEEFRKRLAEQNERHSGGSKWIGTGGTSPFGAGGTNPLGMRVGAQGGGRSAVKVWEQRNYRALDGDADLSPRNFKLALRRLRRFAREGAAEELDNDAADRRDCARRCSTSACGPSGTTRSRSCCCSTSAARWTITSLSARRCSARRRAGFKGLEHFYSHNFVYSAALGATHQLRMSRAHREGPTCCAATTQTTR